MCLRNPFVFTHLIILKVLSSKWWLGGSIPCARASCRMSMSFLHPCASFSNLWKNNRKVTHCRTSKCSSRHKPQSNPQIRQLRATWRSRPHHYYPCNIMRLLQASLLLSLSHNENLTNPITFKKVRQTQAWNAHVMGWLIMASGRSYRVVSATFPRCINCLEYCKHFCQQQQTNTDAL